MMKRKPAKWPWLVYWLLLITGIVLASTESKGAEPWEQERPSHDAFHFFIGAGWQYVCTEKLDVHPVACFAVLAAGVAVKEYAIDDNPNFLGRDGLGYAGGAATVTLFTWRF